MAAPDAIADRALLAISQWQRETSQQAANRLLYRDQARRWESNDNQSLDEVDRAIAAVVAEIEQ